ncbi:uncharacterized protein PGTG_04234 [Puccinia graminis f. sp. tritici CRL 75-36-700-3]|uniref:MmgE/PrpD C-terminal domain-containing protein n=1 Tax=Puccinia graminis f. sp. tritici (strain CRL 75-36-700-3 / race SCCL) TaxID=418459 RepID=E3K2V8_PUCGT|nr:uncharacterized protein PGTG_04234 [Puccinia graminis f. sp. tritici CRL 75-36-700-3]EFP78278.2 hypothetical protein PGTG_04234 [Puccinia graminis f. sp. tritici CRL 75-36-700-3]
MVTIPLIFGRLTTGDYTDKVALDLKIDELRAKISCTEEKKYSAEYHPPDKCSIGNAIMIELKDRTVLDKVEIKYSVGPKRPKILEVVNDQKTLENFDVEKFMDLWAKS